MPLLSCARRLVRASLLPLSFAFKKDGRPAAHIVPSICNAVDARRAVPALMKLAGHSRCFLPSFSISAASVLSCLPLRSFLSCPSCSATSRRTPLRPRGSDSMHHPSFSLFANWATCSWPLSVGLLCISLASSLKPPLSLPCSTLCSCHHAPCPGPTPLRCCLRAHGDTLPRIAPR